MAHPRLAYLVCATQRSGSTLLCRALSSTAVAGVPEEYFEARAATGLPPTPRDYGLEVDGPPPPAPHYSALAGIGDYADHIARTLGSGTTPNGVFGAKLMWDQLPELRTLTGGEPPALFDELFGPPRYVRVQRRDRARQAISLWKAIQTQAWSANTDADVEPVYDFAAIDHLKRRLDAAELGWDDFFATHDIAPLAFDYDDVAGNLRGSVRAVLEHLDLDPAPADSVEPPLQRQADARTEEWARRYDQDSRKGAIA